MTRGTLLCGEIHRVYRVLPCHDITCRNYLIKLCSVDINPTAEYAVPTQKAFWTILREGPFFLECTYSITVVVTQSLHDQSCSSGTERYRYHVGGRARVMNQRGCILLPSVFDVLVALDNGEQPSLRKSNVTHVIANQH